jgi:YD repeat-containing protein
VSDSLGGLLTMTYDTRDELTTEQFSGTGLSAQAVTYSYDNAGRLTGITRYSNLAETTEVAATAYSYDHANRMTVSARRNHTRCASGLPRAAVVWSGPPSLAW